MKVFFLWTAVIISIVSGHGFLEDPPYRAYYAGYDTPQGMNCGGISNQWDKYGGVCGVCGDDYGGIQHNMAGGKFARGEVTATYTQGQNIDVKVKITANHLGVFNFSLCVNNDFNKKITEECLAQHPLTITDTETGFVGLQWPLPGDVSHKTLSLKLPEDVHCSQCVLRWYWKGGNNWGRDPVTGIGCKGCAEKQECFVNCADIEILGTGKPEPTTKATRKPVTTTKATTTPSVKDDIGCHDNMVATSDNDKQCTAKDTREQDVVEFCQNICSRSTFCPRSHCVCVE